ncbi:MAG: TerC family protein [Sphingobacteriaceae bacterium]|nr:MAG: TerC family protein [Sphingobacteriaceae bacterium]
MLIGGLFLIYKSTHEIHGKIEGEEEGGENVKGRSFWATIVQIMLLDIVFSLDSVITAVGMADHVEVMIVAVVVAVGIMLWASGGIARFVNQHPTVKMLALSFLLLIGVSLLAEAFEQHIPKGYIYFAMAFSVLVEMLNLKVKSKSTAKEIAEK